MLTFSLRFKELRELKNLSQRAIAQELGISSSTVGMWESGKREPDFKTIDKLAQYFNVSSDFLLDRNSDGWDLISLPPVESDAYGSICNMLLNLANVYKWDTISGELRATNPDRNRLFEIAKIFRYDATSFNVLISNCIKQSKRDVDTTGSLSSYIETLADVLEQLNDEGREKLLDYASDLVAGGRYIKTGSAGLGQKEA